MFGLFKKKNTIQSEILSDLRQAKKSIKVAVSWITDPILITELIRKTEQGIDIKIIVSANKLNFCQFELFKKIQELGGSVVKWGNPETQDGSFMHCKFCIIDDFLAKSGSYNWSENAKTNAETWHKVPVTDVFSEFNNYFSESLDFFNGITDPKKIKEELNLIRKNNIQEELTPEIIKAYEDAQKYRKEYEVKQRFQEEQTRIAEQRTKELEIQLSRERAERDRLDKIEADRRLQEQQAAAIRASALEIQLAKEKAERESERQEKLEKEQKILVQQEEQRTKEKIERDRLTKLEEERILLAQQRAKEKNLELEKENQERQRLAALAAASVQSAEPRFTTKTEEKKADTPPKTSYA